MHSDLSFEADTLDDLLGEVLPRLLSEQEVVKASRGDFWEVFGVMLVLRNPRARLSRTESRGKIFSALGELFWYLSRGNSYEFIRYYISKGYEKESENDDNSVRSGYGDRLFALNKQNQVQNVIDLLRHDNKPTSRRAVIQLFDASDLSKAFRSIPCTCTLQFMVRQDKLNLLVNMRSNDAYVGLPHDVFAFTMLQELIARSIGVDVGVYKHCVGSLHLYTEHQDPARAFLAEGWQSPIAMDRMPEGDPWPAVQIVRGIEEMARAGSDVDLSTIELEPYWKDLCRLFLVFQAVKRSNSERERSYEACKLLRQQMSSPVYQMFVDAKLESLAI